MDVKIIDTAPNGVKMEVIDLYPEEWTIFYRKKGESEWISDDVYHEHIQRIRYPDEPWDLQFYNLDSSTTYEYKICQYNAIEEGTHSSFTTKEAPIFNCEVSRGDRCAMISTTTNLRMYDLYYGPLYTDSLLTRKIDNYSYNQGAQSNGQYGSSTSISFWELNPDTDYYSYITGYTGEKKGLFNIYNMVMYKIHFKTYECTNILDVENVMYKQNMKILMDGLDDKLLQIGLSDYNFITCEEEIGRRWGMPTIGIVYDYDNTNMMVTKDLISRGAYHQGESYIDFPNDTEISYRAYYIPYPSYDIISDKIDFEKVINTVVYGPTKKFKVNVTKPAREIE